MTQQTPFCDKTTKIILSQNSVSDLSVDSTCKCKIGNIFEKYRVINLDSKK